MAAETFPHDNYYDAYDAAGWDIGLMRSALADVALPDDVRDSLTNTPAATFLVLGSATSRNITHLAAIDRELRPGQGSNDTIVMIDYNSRPLEGHQREWRWLQPMVRGADNTYKDQQYPHFVFGQADMRQLPVRDGALDVVVSDYTFNFLGAYGDIHKTFGEVERVLRPLGVMLMSVAGREGVDPTIPVSDLPDLSAQQKERWGGLVTTQFPLQLYTGAAAEHGLALRASAVVGSDFLCAVLHKTA